MILADENIHFAIIKALRETGIDVYSVSESNSGIADYAVIELSLNPPRIILTEDKDFGEWVFAHHVKNISVIFLRYNIHETHIIINSLIRLIAIRGADLMGKFTTITTQKIRIREF